MRGQRPGWAQLLPHGPRGSASPSPRPLSSNHPVEKGYFKPPSDLVVSLLSSLKEREGESESECVCVCGFGPSFAALKEIVK